MSNSKRKCHGCKKHLRQDTHDWRQAPVGWFHDLDCQLTFARGQVEKQKASRAKKEKKENRKKKFYAKGLSHSKKLTQTAVNRYIRLRDSGKPCISCGRGDGDISTNALHGSVWDAGHFKSVGAHPELRFNLKNINRQCRKCNSFEGGAMLKQRDGILQRFGQERLDWLDGHHDAKHYTIEQLARLRKIINKRAKRYQNN